MGPYRLPPEKSLSEHWKEIKKHPVQLWIIVGLLTSALAVLLAFEFFPELFAE